MIHKCTLRLWSLTCCTSALDLDPLDLARGEAPLITSIIRSIHCGVQKVRPDLFVVDTPLRKPRVAHVSCCCAATELMSE